MKALQAHAPALPDRFSQGAAHTCPSYERLCFIFSRDRCGAGNALYCLAGPHVTHGMRRAPAPQTVRPLPVQLPQFDPVDPGHRAQEAICDVRPSAGAAGLRGEPRTQLKLLARCTRRSAALRERQRAEAGGDAARAGRIVNQGDGDQRPCHPCTRLARRRSLIRRGNRRLPKARGGARARAAGPALRPPPGLMLFGLSE
jgi:hypothetical protein